MYRLSSNTTLFFRLFLPTAWLVFFGLFTIAVWVSNENMGALNHWYVKLGLTLFFLSGLIFFILTFFRLRRVESDGKFLYVSNYFKTYRYDVGSIDNFRETGIIFFAIGHFELKHKGKFGKVLHFIITRKNVEEFKRAYPEVFA